MLGKGWFPSQLGGLERYYRELLEHLPEARGVVVGPAEDADRRLTSVSDHAAPLPFRLLAFTRAARREALNADVIDAHFALYAWLPVLIGRLRRKPLVVHFQGPWADENVSAGDRSRLRRFARRRLERAVYSRAQLVITLTGAFRRVLIERYGVSPWNTEVLAPGVDLERFYPGDRVAARSRFGLPPEVFVACCTRRLVRRMGLGELIQAWAQVVVGDANARLLIAGEGELREELEREIAVHSIGGSVTLLGRVSDEDLVALYRAADVNVVPSVSIEGFGLVVLEAAACGTPSIVTRVGGLPEAVAGLGHGLTVPAADVGALAARLRRAASGELPGREDTRSWAEGHRWEQVASTHRELIDRTLRNTDTNAPKLRVVYLDHVAQLSGGELALLRLLEALSDVDAHVVLAEDGPLVDRLLEAGISVEVLPMARRTRLLRKDAIRPGHVRFSAVLDTLSYTFRLALRLRRMRPHIVHTNSLKSGVYGAIASHLTGTPIVWHLRDRVDTDYLPPLAVRLIRTLTRRLPDAVIANSQSTLQTVRPAGRSVVSWQVVADMTINHALDESRWEDVQPRAQERRAFVVGMVGRLAPWKGQDVFLRAFARAFARGPQQALIVGAPLFGEAELAYADDLRSLAKRLGIDGQVQFRGHREDIARELRAIDVLVHASVIREPFGQVVVEGMAAGLPVVASRGGGPDEVIDDGVDGLLYPRGDISALADLLVRLEAEPQLRAHLGHAAARRATIFSPAAMTSQVMRTYGLARRSPTNVKESPTNTTMIGSNR